MHLSTRTRTALAILPAAAVIAPMASAGGEPKNEWPFTRAVAARAPAGSPVGFLSHVVRLIAANRYADAYPLLDPQQRRFISEQEYIQCEVASPVPGRLSSLHIMRTVRQRIRIAGGSTKSVPAIAATFELELTGFLPDESATVELTAHAVAVGNRWTWILSPRRFQLHRSGSCGA